MTILSPIGQTLIPKNSRNQPKFLAQHHRTETHRSLPNGTTNQVHSSLDKTIQNQARL